MIHIAQSLILIYTIFVSIYIGVVYLCIFEKRLLNFPCTTFLRGMAVSCVVSSMYGLATYGFMSNCKTATNAKMCVLHMFQRTEDPHNIKIEYICQAYLLKVLQIKNEKAPLQHHPFSFIIDPSHRVFSLQKFQYIIVPSISTCTKHDPKCRP